MSDIKYFLLSIGALLQNALVHAAPLFNALISILTIVLLSYKIRGYVRDSKGSTR